MSCIITTLTVVSALSNGVWNDIEVNTNSKLVDIMNEQISASAEMVSETKRISKTKTVTCGDSVYSVTNSTLEVED